MTTYDVLVSDELLPEFTNDNPLLPLSLRIIGPAEGPAGYHQKRFRVEDGLAPAWTEGRLITPTFTADYDDDGNQVRSRVTGWHEEDEAAVRIGSGRRGTA